MFVVVFAFMMEIVSFVSPDKLGDMGNFMFDFAFLVFHALLVIGLLHWRHELDCALSRQLPTSSRVSWRYSCLYVCLSWCAAANNVVAVQCATDCKGWLCNCNVDVCLS